MLGKLNPQESMAVRGVSSSDDAQEISDDQNATASKTQVIANNIFPLCKIHSLPLFETYSKEDPKSRARTLISELFHK